MYAKNKNRYNIYGIYFFLKHGLKQKKSKSAVFCVGHNVTQRCTYTAEYSYWTTGSRLFVL